MFNRANAGLHFSALLFSICLNATAGGLPASSGFGLDNMAPAGHWASRLTILRNGYREKYDNSGRLVDLDTGVDGLSVDSTVLPSLAPLGSGATLGTISLDTQAATDYQEILLGYGVSENLTVGVILPWTTTHTKALFSLSGGNVGLNPLFNPAQPISAVNYPFAPVGGPVTPMTTADFQTLLSDPVYGYAYKPIASTGQSGLADPTLGALWRFRHSGNDSAVLGLGFKFGTAPEDDPNDLLDIPVGSGANAIRLRFEYFRDLGHGIDLHLLAENFTQLPDHVTMRVPTPGSLLAPASSTEKLKRDLGDYQEFDVELGYSLGDWRTSATWHRYQKPMDHYISPIGTNTAALEANTDTLADQFRLGFTWSGIKAWQAGKLPLPLIIRLEMQDAFNGRNFVDVRDYYLRLTSLF